MLVEIQHQCLVLVQQCSAQEVANRESALRRLNCQVIVSRTIGRFKERTIVSLFGGSQLCEPHDVLPALVRYPVVGARPGVALQRQVALEEEVQELQGEKGRREEKGLAPRPEAGCKLQASCLLQGKLQACGYLRTGCRVAPIAPPWVTQSSI